MLGGKVHVPPAISAIFSGISSAGRMNSAAPVAMALRGMAGLMADPGSWTMTIPPASLTPSPPWRRRCPTGEDHGDGALLQLRGEGAEKTVDGVVRRLLLRLFEAEPAFAHDNLPPAGITWTVSGWSGIPSSAVTTAMGV